ncbi:hypothetical protein IE81DRAFT_166598 [Ceraceosorus guamensis]|uniref:AN1-type domain-containing protein n=1 Tax=Ceraceosorus guamensis TaxID=1522189 RepID=A0A316W6Y6_9BASI|nr:hypothetical protein IE81DRAFT_166598 [Ceraceosorus guamensis]PWN45706.1 hypothetical protein IE81DRAFT_166598 [Ceraceosorus guamensis]
MDVGVHCPLSSCLTLTFLPISCPYCRKKFCESHFLPSQHACSAPGSSSKHLSDSELVRLVARANPGTDRTPCQSKGCKGKSLQVGKQGMGISVAEGSSAGVSHAAPRCERCGGLFCMKHRSAISHKCTVLAPITEGKARLQAADERKRRAQEILAKNFPGRSTGASVKSGGPAFKAQAAVVTSEGVPMGKDTPSSSQSGGSQAGLGKDVSEEQLQSLETGITPTEPGEDGAHFPQR